MVMAIVRHRLRCEAISAVPLFAAAFGVSLLAAREYRHRRSFRGRGNSTASRRAKSWLKLFGVAASEEAPEGIRLVRHDDALKIFRHD